MTTPSDTDVAWLAGLLEGEGTFHLQVNKYAVVCIAMIDKDIIEKVAVMWSVNVTVTTLPSYRLMYKAALCGRRSIPWLILLRPLMGARRQSQIDKILSVYNKGQENETVATTL